MRSLAFCLAALVAHTDALHAQITREAFAAQSGSAINCTIRPSQTVEVSAALAGTVAEVMVRPGQGVRAGDVMITLDASVAEQERALAKLRTEGRGALERAEAQVAALSKTVERLDRGFQRNAVSVADLEAAQRDLALAEADLTMERERLALAQADLARAEVVVDQHVITAPVNGLVGEALIDPGESTAQGAVATIYVNDPLRVEAFVPAARLEAFLEQTSPQIIVNGREEAPVPVALDYAAPLADLASGTISVYFVLSSTDVLPGSKCVFAGAGL